MLHHLHVEHPAIDFRVYHEGRAHVVAAAILQRVCVYGLTECWHILSQQRHACGVRMAAIGYQVLPAVCQCLKQVKRAKAARGALYTIGLMGKHHHRPAHFIHYAAGDDTNHAQIRMIQTDNAVGDKWVVTEGLKAGEKVIMEGLLKARPGAEVIPEPFKPEAEPPKETAFTGKK